MYQAVLRSVVQLSCRLVVLRGLLGSSVTGLLGRLKSFLDVGGTKAEAGGEATFWTQAVLICGLHLARPAQPPSLCRVLGPQARHVKGVGKWEDKGHK